MATLLGLKDFQWASVEAVCDGLRQRSIFALADEVGLGKTLVCAEVINQLLGRHAARKEYLIYYVAPSIELLDQNLRSIRRYLEGRCAEHFNVWTSISRLSQIPRDYAEHRRRLRPENRKKGVIHVVGLSPETSFNLRGAGQRSERQYLAALFGYRRHSESKMRLARLFWCLKRTLDLRVEQGYSRKIESYASDEYLGSLSAFRDTEVFRRLITEIEATDLSSSIDTRMKVAEIRQHVVAFILQSMHPNLVIFDEWHKYKSTCFSNKLLGNLLEQSRKTSETKVMLVSATPFSVEFNDSAHADSPVEDRGDLKGLLQMVWGKDDYLKNYEQLVAHQNAYLSEIGSYLKEPMSGDARLTRARDAYQQLLRGYCCRTERPRTEISESEMKAHVREGDWREIRENGSLRRFIDRFSTGENARSPILGMWSDGLTFPSYGYAGLTGHSKKDITGIHWKVMRLANLLRRRLLFEDGLHSARYPPLWLHPAVSRKDLKHLIFSEFLFVPHEVCRRLDAAPFRFGSVSRKKWTGSVLGYFPTMGDRRTKSTQSAAEAIHFVMFYSFLIYELSETERARTLADKQLEVGRLIDEGVLALDTLKKIEELFCREEADRIRLQYRWQALDTTDPIPASRRFKNYLRFLFVHGRVEWSIGYSIARVARQLLDQEVGHIRSPGVIREFEAATIRLSGAVLRLFASPESQTLKKRARVKLPRSIPRGWNSHLRYAMWYSKKYAFEATLREFARLLTASGASGEAVVDEIGASIGLRKGTVGNRFVRSFHDRKIGDAEYADEADETISLKSLRAAFNSPFPPYVLVSTSVGQEGLDFHRYCASIIHWSPPSSPSVLRQREGRLDRFQALQIRRALEEVGDRIGAGQEGMCPDFVVMKEGRRINKVDREVWYLPFTSQEASWNTCLQRMHYNDLLIGAPDPLSDEQLLLGSVGTQDLAKRIARFQTLRAYAISLKPRSLSAAEIGSLKGG